MSLARGIDSVHYDQHSAMVIAIAATAEERLRLAALVSDHAPVMLVGSREEALALLRGRPMAEAVSAEVVPVRPVDPHRPSLVVDSDLREARWLDRRVPLSPLEHDLMLHLLRNLGRTLTFERLHRTVWGTDHFGGGGDVQSVVKRLRRKLDDLDSSLRIHPVRGVGLRLVDTADRG